MLNPLYTENYNHNVLISSAGVTITYKFTSFSLNPFINEKVMKRFLSQNLSIIHRLSLQMSDEPKISPYS